MRILINNYRWIRAKLKYRKTKINSPYVLLNNKIANHVSIGIDAVVSNSQIDEYTYINKNTILQYTKVGRFCSVSYNCVIGAAEHNLANLSTSPYLEIKKNTVRYTIIEDDVWIGANVVIKAGLNIGKGAVIGAGSIVTKDIPPYSIVAGVPAKVLKSCLDYFTDKEKECLINLDFKVPLEVLMNYQDEMEVSRK